MSSYLARLKVLKQPPYEPPKLPKGQNETDSILPKPSKAPFGSKGSVCTGRISESKASAVTSSMTPTDRHLSDESDRRADFCETHRRMIGGVCNWNNNLDGCLLWELIRVGEKIELAAGHGIVEGITVGDVLQWARHPEDIDRMRKNRRLF